MTCQTSATNNKFAKEEGVAMFEFTIVLPFLLLLFLGMLQFSLIYDARFQLNRVCFQAARHAIVRQDQPNWFKSTQEKVTEWNTHHNLNIQLTNQTNMANVGSLVSINAEGILPLVIPYLNKFTQNTRDVGKQNMLLQTTCHLTSESGPYVKH